jgi:hypothetical protein
MNYGLVFQRYFAAEKFTVSYYCFELIVFDIVFDIFQKASFFMSQRIVILIATLLIGNTD